MHAVRAQLPVAVVDTTLLARHAFARRATNRAIRARFDLATTQYQIVEARRFGFHVPEFVRIVDVYVDREHLPEIAPPGEWGLSRADVALHQLRDDLARAGRAVVLVTDDGLLLSRVAGSLDGTKFLELASRGASA